MILRSTLAAAILASTLAYTPDASAVNRTRTFFQLATGTCDAVNPAYDGNLRRVSVGIQNASSSYTQIACGLLSDDYASDGLQQVFIYFRNPTSTARTVTCIMSAGTPYYGINTSTKSYVLGAGQYTFLSWSPGTDFPVGKRTAQLLCTLPPGYIAQEIGWRYNEDVGT